MVELPTGLSYQRLIIRQEVVLIRDGTPLTKDSFLYLAKEAGLDTSSPHMDELYQYVRSVLAGLQSLHRLDVDGIEPDTAFIPAQE
jgi:Asp-tRNA(Asn)/Glu-tRNA(Gln) amidotransferase C subunit